MKQYYLQGCKASRPGLGLEAKFYWPRPRPWPWSRISGLSGLGLGLGLGLGPLASASASALASRCLASLASLIICSVRQTVLVCWPYAICQLDEQFFRALSKMA